MVPTFYFWDRSMIGDYIFALWNHLTGGITAQEFEVYESEFGGGIDRIDQLPFLQDISFFVFLNDEPERCKYRVEHQRGNQSEQGIPLRFVVPSPSVLPPSSFSPSTCSSVSLLVTTKA